MQFLYIGLWKPFENKKQNKIELINETCILVISVLLPGFTDFLSDETGQKKTALGWVVIAILGI
jgi:hypothetical protein